MLNCSFVNSEQFASYLKYTCQCFTQISWECSFLFSVHVIKSSTFIFLPLIWKTVRREKDFAGPLIESYFPSCLLVEVNDRSAFWHNEQACQNCGGLYISTGFGLPKSFLLLSTNLVLQPKILAKSNNLSNVFTPYYLDQVTVHFLLFNAQYPAPHGHPSKAILNC